jgi:hypothetical protein
VLLHRGIDMTWEKILKKKPAGYYKTSERKKRKKAKGEIKSTEQRLSVLEERRKSLIESRDEQDRNKKIQSKIIQFPLVTVLDKGKERPATQKEIDSHRKNQLKEQAAEYRKFREEYGTKIEALDNQIKVVKDKLKKLKGR